MTEDWLNRDFLVFEATDRAIPAYTTFLHPQTLVGHVRAENEDAAALVAAGVTGRIDRRYAVVEVTMIDLPADGTDVIKSTDDTTPRGAR